ncbi:MAG: polysaccharide biosynthesis tyrosine autokinase [Candidatus Saccharibacteria bacterium]|nr:polysaccharide biosynthesis tyrosine autokinase [Candidatus Saccharibacteria bacterium]
MEEINLKDFLGYLKKFVPAIIIVAILAVGATLIYDMQIKTPLYSTYTKVLLMQDNASNNSSATLNDVSANQKLATTYSEFVKSRLVLQQVIDKLHLDCTADELAKNVSVTNVTDTQVLKITVTDPSAENAQKIADTTTTIFAKEITDITGIDNVKPYEVAQLPEEPSNNTLKRDIAIAAIIAVFGVLAVAFIIFYFDDSVKYSEDLEKKIGLPIAGKIIKSGQKARKGRKIDELIVQKYPKSAVSESIKALRTNLQFSSVDSGFKTVLLTSSVASEGKSFVSSNLAISFAQSGKKVLIIDCDLRKGRLHKIFHLPNTFGLSNLLADDITKCGKYIQRTGIGDLYMITRGAYPPNPSELLGSKKNRALIEKLKTKFDVIVFDGAPCNGVTDSVIMSTIVDEVLIVTKDSSTSKSALESTKEMLQKVNAPIAGIVMNGVSKKEASYYGYYGDGTRSHGHSS